LGVDFGADEADAPLLAGCADAWTFFDDLITTGVRESRGWRNGATCARIEFSSPRIEERWRGQAMARMLVALVYIAMIR
jgi:hypothetical protein